MKLKWLVFAALIATAAAIPHRRLGARDIPVQVIYDSPAVRNLDDKPQLPVEAKPEGVKNLEAKPQLSSEEAKEALKHLPVQVDDANKVKIVTPDLPVEVFQPQPIPAGPNAAYQQGEEQNIDDIYDKIQEIINNGAKKLKADFENIPDDEHKKDVLEKVNLTFDEFLETTKKLIETRNVQTLKQAAATTSSPLPNPANFFQQILSSFQNFQNNLFSGLNPSGTQSDGSTAAPGGFPNPIQVAQGIFQQVQGNLGSLFGARPPSGQADEAVSQGPPNPLQFIQQQFSNIFQRPTAAPGNQADEQPASNTNPIVGFVQGAISNVQNVFNPSTAAPAAHDEVTQGTALAGGNNPLQFFQNAGQNLIQSIQNNPFFPGGSTTQAALAGTTVAPASNPAAAAIANVQGQFANAIPNNPFQQQASHAIAAGAAQANQVVSQLSQQGVPVPEQVSSAISAAQQAASGETASTAAPSNSASTPAAPAVSEASADEEAVRDDIPADEIEEEAAPAQLEVSEPVKAVEEPVKIEEVVSEKESVPVKIEDSVPVKIEEPVPVKVEEPAPAHLIKEEISNEVTEKKEEVKP